jgi:hypothetical protein
MQFKNDMFSKFFSQECVEISIFMGVIAKPLLKNTKKGALEL